METEMSLPEVVSVMTLPNVALFPQAILPLHIFEPRYRKMLREALASHRMFAVAGLNPTLADYEPPHRIATVGIVRACQDAENGTSNLLLQGLYRVEIVEIVSENPFRRIRIRPLSSEAGAPAEANAKLRQRVGALIAAKRRLGAHVSKDLIQYLGQVDDPGAFVDLAAFNLCEDDLLRQQLLETLNVNERLQILQERFETEVSELRLRRKLQGRLSDDDISAN